MKKLITAIFIGFLAIGLFASSVTAVVNAVTPSTNEDNETNGWAYVEQVSKGVGTTDLKFTSTRSLWSCFEYRADNESNTVVGPNPNLDITDGRWTQVCVYNSTQTKTILANEYVDVRMVFGGERDERFDWTRFDVLQPPVPSDKDDCKKDGWMEYVDGEGNPFKNQGQCVSYVETRKHDPVLLETIEVDATTASSTDTTMTYELGKEYLIEVSGTYVYWPSCPEFAPCEADANYSLRPSTSFGTGWVSLDGTAYEGYLKLKIDGSDVDWGDFNPDHEYATSYIGTGSFASFSILDDGYGDNSGYLTVKLYEVN